MMILERCDDGVKRILGWLPNPSLMAAGEQKLQSMLSRSSDKQGYYI